MEDRFAHHLDLARTAVTGMHLQTAVVGLQHHAHVGDAGERRPNRRAIRPDVGLDSAEQRRPLLLDDCVVVNNETVPVAREDKLHLPSVPAPRGKQRVLRQRRGGILGAAHDRRQLVRGRSDACPQLGRRVKEEEVHVPRDGKGTQDFEIRGREACEPEQR